MMRQAYENAKQHLHDEHIARALGISTHTLARYPFSLARTPVTTMWRDTGMIYGWRILWANEAPPGIDVNGTAGSLWSDIPAGLEERS